MLEVKNLVVGYGDVEILHNISFTVPSCKNVVILGQNGCGKTTLLKAIAGLLPYKGSIRFNGVELSTRTIKERSREIALMSQFSMVEFDYSVEEAVEMGRYAHQKSGFFQSKTQEDIRIVSESITVAGLQDLKDVSVKKLSGGQLQRVFFARAIAQQPNLLLLDEPTNHLDLKHQAELLHYVIDWSKKKNLMTMGVLHDINQGMKLGDYGILLKDGYIIQQGILEDIISKDSLNQVYDMNVYGYMIDSLKKWENIKDE